MSILTVAGNRSVLEISLSVVTRSYTSIADEFDELGFVEQAQNEFSVIDHELTKLETRRIELHDGI